jgi:hypothetical protein
MKVFNKYEIDGIKNNTVISYPPLYIQDSVMQYSVIEQQIIIIRLLRILSRCISTQQIRQCSYHVPQVSGWNTILEFSKFFTSETLNLHYIIYHKFSTH